MLFNGYVVVWIFIYDKNDIKLLLFQIVKIIMEKLSSQRGGVNLSFTPIKQSNGFMRYVYPIKKKKITTRNVLFLIKKNVQNVCLQFFRLSRRRRTRCARLCSRCLGYWRPRGRWLFACRKCCARARPTRCLSARRCWSSGCGARRA
jgi:hypothetical protein